MFPERGNRHAGMLVSLGKTQENEMRDVRSGNLLFRNRNEVLFVGIVKIPLRKPGKHSVS